MYHGENTYNYIPLNREVEELMTVSSIMIVYQQKMMINNDLLEAAESISDNINFYTEFKHYFLELNKVIDLNNENKINSLQDIFDLEVQEHFEKYRSRMLANSRSNIPKHNV